MVRGILRVPVTAVENATPEVHVRLGRPSEVVDLRHKVLRDGRPRETAIWGGDDDPETRHWVAEHDGTIIGIASVMRMDAPPEAPKSTWQLRGMAVDPGWRGKGIGGVVLQAVHTDVAEPLWANARIRAVAFYERHGWTAVSDAFDIEGVGPHKRIFKDL